MKTLAIILARGGSKRVPRKNIRPFCGMPLIGWTLMHAGMCRSFLDEIAVSTDDSEIAEFAESVPFPINIIRRPKHLASDSATSYDAMKHAYYTMGGRFEFMCLLQPTSPLRIPLDILETFRLCLDTDLPAAISCERGKLVANGAVYMGRTDWLLDGGNFDTPGIAEKYFMPPERSHDIDTPEDFEKAERLALEGKEARVNG